MIAVILISETCVRITSKSRASMGLVARGQWRRESQEAIAGQLLSGQDLH